MKVFDPTTKVYCTQCRRKMNDKMPGSVVNYFRLFSNVKLDPEDCNLLARLMQGQGLCGQVTLIAHIHKQTLLHILYF